MKKFIISLAFAAAIVPGACASPAAQPNYTLTVADDPSLNGKKIYITNYDTGEPVDSTVVTDGKIVISGTIDTPLLGRMVIGGNRGPIFIVEPGTITLDLATGDATGTPLNDSLTDFSKQQEAIIATFKKEFPTQPTDSAEMARAMQLQDSFERLLRDAIDRNADNPIGLYLLLNNIYENTSIDGLEATIARYPILAGSARVAKYRESLAKVEATSPGKMFTDFTIDYNGKSSSLSDYVGKGHYTLVDFWASWCGPCIREIRTLKELYREYSDKGLDFLGVAVWDEPANTESAIKRHDIPWPCIINAQSIPTDLYGISGIPCIILFAPDGTIVSRGLQGEELVRAVREVMASTPDESGTN